MFPRLIQRIAFNLLLGRVKRLRRDTLDVFKAHGLQGKAMELNEMLGPHKRPSTLAFADELMYAVNFAGVGGTQHGAFATLSFMQRRTIDIKPEAVTFPPGHLPNLYKENPDAFIKEVVRLDAPVTSATCAFAEATTVAYKAAPCCGAITDYTLPAGTLHQYVLSIANRDPAKFDEPDKLNPSRANLDDMLGWNGALSNPSAYPRICPGRYLSIVVIKAIVGMCEDV